MIVIGTALAVSPFNLLVNDAPKYAHQVLINRENTSATGFDFTRGKNRLFIPGDCDDTIHKLDKDLGYDVEF